MEAEGYGCRCAGIDHGSRYVPIVANHAQAGCVVPEYRNDGSFGLVLCDGNLPSDLILRHVLCCSTRALVISKPVRRCWIL